MAIPGPLDFHMNFRIGLSLSAKESARILRETALTLDISLENTTILNLLSLLIHEHEMCFHLFRYPAISFDNAL